MRKYSPSNPDFTPNDIGQPDTIHYADHELLSDAEMFEQLEKQEEFNLF